MFERIKLTQLNDHLWLMDDNGESTGYIVAGKDRAAVIDTMNGYEDVRAVAAGVTDRPVIVINTHGHCDHIYGNVFFDGALIDEKDLPVARAHCEFEDFKKLCEKSGLKMPPFATVKDGDVIDLGDLTLEVISLPGHTPGSICLLLREDRILFTGDSVNRHLWVQLDESLPLREALANLDRIAWVKDRADRILHGHARGFEDISLFDRLREGLRQLCEQTDTQVSDEDADYIWFGGKALQHSFDGDSVIIYTRDKLKIDMAPGFAGILSCCGCDCAGCESGKNGRCPGCVASKGQPSHMKAGEICAVASCCIEHGRRWCADCADFPCERLKSFSYDPEYGDRPAGARIERLRSMKRELLGKARQGQRRVTVCGFCCGDTCFLGEWCGWCGSEYSCCSYATVQPDGVCPNLRCVAEKGIDGCWECPEMMECTKGFYGNEAEPAAVELAKAGVLFIREYGERAFLRMQQNVLARHGQRCDQYVAGKSGVQAILEQMKREIPE